MVLQSFTNKYVKNWLSTIPFKSKFELLLSIIYSFISDGIGNLELHVRPQ